MQVIEQESGNRKTVCVGTVLEYLGIPQDRYKWTWNNRTRDNVWLGILGRNGYGYGSRLSKFKKGVTMSQLCKMADGKLDEGLYIVRVDRHVILIDGKGRVIVDTSPRKSDRRLVKGIYKVTAKSDRMKRLAVMRDGLNRIFNEGRY